MNNEKVGHTSLPWAYKRTHLLSGDHWYVIVDKNGRGPTIDIGGKDENGQIGEMKYLITDPQEIEANAAFIVKACNSYYQMAGALKLAIYVSGGGYVGMGKRAKWDKQLLDTAKAALKSAGIEVEMKQITRKASDMGFRPGEWPALLRIDGEPFVIETRTMTRDGKTAEVTYKNLAGDILAVANDLQGGDHA